MLAAEGAVARCREWNVSGLIGRVGVHLQLTNGRPILPITQISGLIDQSTGRFRPKSELANLDLEDVEREWRAQIEMGHELLKAKPSHLDSHHGAHHIPGLADVFIRLAIEFDLPIRDCTAMREYRPDLRLLGSDIVLYKWSARGLSSVDLQNKIQEALANSCDEDILELVTHPGFSNGELRNISTLSDLREEDFASLLSLMHVRWLELEGIQLISFSEIQGQ